MATNSSTYIKDIATCAICLDYYKDPRLLSCSHTYCHNCIKQSIKSNKFVCPFNDGTTVDAKGIDNLPLNRTAKDMAEFILSMSQDYAHLNCGNCTNNKCSYWCERCDSYLCVKCSESIHSQKVHQSHVVVTANQKPVSNICLDHPDEKIKLWCVVCETFLCRDCLLFKHKDHSYASLQDVATETKLQVKQSLQPIRENLEKAALTVRNTIEEEHQIYMKNELEINETFEKLYNYLKVRKMKLIQQLNEHQVQQKSSLEKYETEINQLSKAIKARDALMQKIFDTNDNIQIMKMKKTLLDYDHQIDHQYRSIEQGCAFSKASIDMSTDLKQKIGEYGTVRTNNVILKLNSIQPKVACKSLDLSRPVGPNATFPYEANWCRGYIFQMQKPLKIQSVRIEASIHGQVVVYVINSSGCIIEKATFVSNDTTMKWTEIPISAELNTGYSILVWSPNTNGKFAYQQGDNNFRTVDQLCSIESKYAVTNCELSIGKHVELLKNTFSIRMMIDCEQ